MSGSLSQDELDALLADSGGFGGDSSAPGADPLSASDKASMEKLADAFRSSASGVGVMLGASSSSMDATRMEGAHLNDIRDRFAESFVLIQSPLSGPVFGTLTMCIGKDDVASVAASAMGGDASSIQFSEDDLASVQELLGPMLVAVARALSSIVGGQVQSGALQSSLTGSGNPFPVSDDAFGMVLGKLNIDGIMSSDVALLVPTPLLHPVTGGATIAPGDPGRKGIESEKSAQPNTLTLLMDVQMPLTVELGRTRMYVKEILGMGEGSIIELDKLAQEPVDLMVNGKLIARGEVVVIDENFGVRVTNIVSPTERMKMTGKQ